MIRYQYGSLSKQQNIFFIQRHLIMNELLQIVRTAQKGLYVGKYEILSGEASRKRRLSGYYFSAEGCKAAFNNRPLCG